MLRVLWDALSVLRGGSGEALPHACRRMVAGEDSRVDFGMAEALALGTLALHRGRRPGNCDFGSDLGEQAAAPVEVRLRALSENMAVLRWRLIGLPLQQVLPGLLGVDPDAQERAAASMGLNFGAYAVRVSGQDSERGTFNHRNAVLYDQRTSARRASFAMTPLSLRVSVELTLPSSRVCDAQGSAEVQNGCPEEAAVRPGGCLSHTCSRGCRRPWRCGTRRSGLPGPEALARAALSVFLL